MSNFGVIANLDSVREIVQSRTLERAFHDALYPSNLFRAEASPVPWAMNIGESQVFTAPGLMEPDTSPLEAGTEPEPQSYTFEQWEATMAQYAKTIDTDMPTNYVTIASTFLRNAQQLGLQAAQSLNRKVRNRQYNAAESGHTVADGAQTSVTVLAVKRLNGFTRARNPTLTGASRVKFDRVSASNPLQVRIYDTGGPAFVTRYVVAYSPSIMGDELGPGTITLTGGAVSVADRAVVQSIDRTFVVRAGGGEKVDDIGPSDLPKLGNVRDVVARMQDMNVPTFADGRYHAHLSPMSIAKIFSDPELQRLNTSLPEYTMYKELALTEILGCIFYRNNECPQPSKVVGGTTATFTVRDDFAPELYSDGTTAGTVLHRILFTGPGGIYEYYSDLAQLITEAGILGKTGEFSLSNNGIEVMSERIQMIIRAPLDRLQQKVSMSWNFIGDWPVRTDAATGDAARYKRMCVLIHGS